MGKKESINGAIVKGIKEMQNALQRQNHQEAFRLLRESNLMNQMHHQIDKAMEYYGMPELKFLKSEDLRNELEVVWYEAALKSIAQYSDEKVKAAEKDRKESGMSLNIASTVNSYILLNTKHKLLRYIAEQSRSLYPDTTSHYQEELILAHKGGCVNHITTYDAETVAKAINNARTSNRQKTESKYSNRPKKQPKNDVINCSIKAAAKLQMTYSLPNACFLPKDDFGNAIKFDYRPSRAEVHSMNTAYTDVMEFAKKLFVGDDYKYFEWWFNPRYFGEPIPSKVPDELKHCCGNNMHAFITKQRHTLAKALYENGFLDDVKDYVVEDRKSEGVRYPVDIEKFIGNLAVKYSIAEEPKQKSKFKTVSVIAMPAVVELIAGFDEEESEADFYKLSPETELESLKKEMSALVERIAYLESKFNK